MEAEKLQAMQAENEQLKAQLTKKNEQYIFDLTKALDAANLSEAEKAAALHEMLPNLVEEQKTGKTARQLYGTVSERTDALVNKPMVQERNTKASLMWLDNFLLIFGMLGLVSGVMAMFVPKGTQAASYGLTALLVASAAGGIVFYMMYLFVYQYEYPGADKSKKPKMWKTMLMLACVTIVWFLIFNGAALLPQSLNPVINPTVLTVISIAVLGVRYYLKKQLNIVGSLSAPPRPKAQPTKK